MCVLVRACVRFHLSLDLCYYVGDIICLGLWMKLVNCRLVNFVHPEHEGRNPRYSKRKRRAWKPSAYFGTDSYAVGFTAFELIMCALVLYLMNFSAVQKFGLVSK